MKHTNIYDIAKMAGVSIATVSRVVNGSDKVSARTRERVLKVIEESGYTPNVFAQGLGLDTMHVIGIVVPDISDNYMSSAVSFLEAGFRKNGYDVILGCSGFDLKNKSKHVNFLLSKKIDALVLVGSTYAGSGKSAAETDYIREAAKQVPVIVINGIVKGDNIHSFVCDDRGAVYSVGTRLIAKGRRRILFITDSHSYSAQQKLAGYKDALSATGLPAQRDLIVHAHHNRVHETLDLLSDLSLDFDSAVATDDAMAIGILKYCTGRGIRVPEDCDIIGYNNSSLAICCTPELTSIDSRIERLSEEAVDGVLRILSGEEVPPQATVPCSLVERKTTALLGDH